MTLPELQRVLTQRNIAWKPTTKLHEISIRCPVCKDHEFRMQVNPAIVSKDGNTGWAFCYRRWHAIPLQELLKQLKIDVTIDNEPVIRTDFEAFQDKMQELKNPTPSITAPSVLRTGIKTDGFCKIIPATSWSGKRCLAYLHQRGFTEDIIDTYQLMYDPLGDYRDRVIIPFYERGRLVYFQARDITGNAERKVLNPKETDIGVGKSDLLFNHDQAKKHKNVVVCEGWASSMSAGLNSVAINGKSASHRQRSLLLLNWKDITVMLDHGAEREAFELAGYLKNSTNKVSVVLLPYGDPNDFEHQVLMNHLAQKIPINSVSDAKLYRLQLETGRQR